MKIEENVKTFKRKLNNFFKELTKRGYFARQDWQCCQSCGWAAIQGKSKVVFYHKQDAETLKRLFVYISWAGDGTEICKIANKCGFDTVWDGDRGTRIELIKKVI